jgi:aminoglycoside phosphotransferase (APT) family kinase protein
MADMPPAKVEVNDAVVQCLLGDQRPDLADLPLVRVANGWDNATFRLGDDLAVRLPRRTEAVPLILHEQRYLPGIALRSPVAVPVPSHAESPTSDFALAVERRGHRPPATSAAANPASSFPK